MKKEILLSLHPKYWELIKSGKKTIRFIRSGYDMAILEEVE